MIDTISRQPKHLRMPALLTLILLTACATTPGPPDDEIRKSLLGKSHVEILACAGTPVQENQTEHGLVLRYYREAPMFDESGVFLKGSRPGAHRGCWVSLLFDKDHVVGAEYRSAPESFGDVRLCDGIFESCHAPNRTDRTK